MLSMIDIFENRLVENVAKTKYDFLEAPIKPSPLAMTQWSQSTLLGNNLDFWLSGST
jgi:hypothetical protein